MTVKPLVLWAVHRKYTLRYTHRSNDEVRGVMMTETGDLPFVYLPGARTLTVGDAPSVTLNEHGWEVDARGEVVFRSRKN